MGKHRLTINQVPADGNGSFTVAEVSAVDGPTSKREIMKVSNPAYFPLTLAYDQRQTSGQLQAWFATCVDWRSWPRPTRAGRWVRTLPQSVGGIWYGTG